MIAENWLGVTALNVVGNKAGVRFLQRGKWDTKARLLASAVRAYHKSEKQR
jgi:hypothetical protein